ncbi:MAG: hypothetical protein WBL35_03015 [Ornithinibacter sp.]
MAIPDVDIHAPGAACGGGKAMQSVGFGVAGSWSVGLVQALR